MFKIQNVNSDFQAHQRIFLAGYPGDMGGANTEAWHTIRLWRTVGYDVHLIPTWGKDEKWEKRLDDIGCITHHTSPSQLHTIPGLPGAIVVSLCNGNFLVEAHRFRNLGCRIVWLNCMTFLFEHERHFFSKYGPADAFVFQSKFQKSQLEPLLTPFGYHTDLGHLIHGAFDILEWHFSPRVHQKNEPFVIGRVSRPDQDKWSSNTWPIYHRVQYAKKHALMLGINEQTIRKLGSPPAWAECLPPMSINVKDFFTRLHCMLTINGGARENWPRAGLEAMASGVPIVAQNEWGWTEMIEHGITGFLGNSDEELAHWTATLAYDEELRQQIAVNARKRLDEQLANPTIIAEAWRQLFCSLKNNIKMIPPNSDNLKISKLNNLQNT
jgi:hypothetical protein